MRQGDIRHTACGHSFPASHVNIDTQRCPGCGRTLDAKTMEAVRKSLIGGGQESKKSFLSHSSSSAGEKCRHCGAENQTGDYCGKCHERLSEPDMSWLDK